MTSVSGRRTCLLGPDTSILLRLLKNNQLFTFGSIDARHAVLRKTVLSGALQEFELVEARYGGAQLLAAPGQADLEAEL